MKTKGRSRMLLLAGIAGCLLYAPARILATLCNPLMMAGVVGNLFTLLPWPLDQLDHGTESFGHALVLLLGLILLRDMERSGEWEAAEAEDLKREERR